MRLNEQPHFVQLFLFSNAGGELMMFVNVIITLSIHEINDMNDPRYNECMSVIEEEITMKLNRWTQRKWMKMIGSTVLTSDKW